MERPSRSAIFRSKMKLQKEKEEKNEKQPQLPVHKRKVAKKEEETR